jgi:hypothetical protein
MLKHFALIELDNNECPSIGVIDNIPDSPQGRASFEERFRIAVGSHFDFYLDEVEIDIPDLFTGSAYEDIEVNLGNANIYQVHENYKVRVMETWIY